jgi:3-oxoacyl-[acyl-carrier-protein] synthase-1
MGIAVGSSTSSIDRTEKAYRHLENEQLTTKFARKRVLNPHSPGLFLAKITGITGPNLTISTACSSSGKVFATATRWLNSGLVDAVLVGGVDTLCLSVLHGFDSLQLISASICRPFDENREGINLGEAAGFAILVRGQDDTSNIGIRLSGYGESSDAHHMSHPHPEGLGAKLALNCALKQANIHYDDVDYINLHGTASAANDLIEGQMVGELFKNTHTRAASTKGWTGHTLGAAGIVEAIFSMQSIEHNFIPASLNLQQLDKRLDFAITKKIIHQPVNHALSNSFGFGGNNCCLAFSSADK